VEREMGRGKERAMLRESMGEMGMGMRRGCQWGGLDSVLRA
jgi:hypothetical protein